MNILFPIAGLGSRFKESSDLPKPFVNVKGKSLIEWSLSSLQLIGNYYVIVNGLEQQFIDIIHKIKEKYHLNLQIINIKQSTRGQAETCLLGIEKGNIDQNEPLIITNCDQYTPWNINRFHKFLTETDCDGVVSTYDHGKITIGEPSPYSHIEIDENGYAKRLEEKLAISPLALNGIFYWRMGKLFVDSAKKLMEDNQKWTSGKLSGEKEKYVSLTYNYLIQDGFKITNYHMEPNEFVSFGSPTEILIHIKRSNVKQAVEDLKIGKPIVMVDDYDREFEGDIVLAAEKVTKESLLFAMRHARGLMCLPCTQIKLDQFKIPMMYSNSMDTFGTPFATSIDAVEGVTTGMSVDDRLITIKTFCSDNSQPKSLAQPGHLFPLRARSGLLTERRGHTEGCVEILKLAGLKQVGVIIEIMDEYGKMIKGDTLNEFAKIYGLTFVSIEELYDYVYNKNSTGSVPLSIIDGETLEKMSIDKVSKSN
jgi:3,4-dihydroxy-2-butanone 4-phosphate synthase